MLTLIALGHLPPWACQERLLPSSPTVSPSRPATAARRGGFHSARCQVRTILATLRARDFLRPRK
jgi:hypothetical protein